MINSGKRRICRVGGYPTVAAGTVSPACVKIERRAAENPCPNNHFGAGPHRGVGVTWGGGVGGASSDPTIRAWVISAASVAIVRRGIATAPDNHFAAGPYRAVGSTTQYIIRDAGGRPTVRLWIVSAAGIQIDRLVSSAPDNHFAARPLYGVIPSGLGRIAGTGSRPAVRAGIVSPAAVQVAVITTSASGPDDHLAASPNRRRILSGKRGVDRAGRCPGIAAWVVSAASIQIAVYKVVPTPDDHLGAVPDCRVKLSGGRRVCAARGNPTISSWTVSATSVQDIRRRSVESTPNDHFTTGPYCGMIPAGIGRIESGITSPGIIDTTQRRDLQLVLRAVHVRCNKNAVLCRGSPESFRDRK